MVKPLVSLSMVPMYTARVLCLACTLQNRSTMNGSRCDLQAPNNSAYVRSGVLLICPHMYANIYIQQTTTSFCSQELAEMRLFCRGTRANFKTSSLESKSRRCAATWLLPVHLCSRIFLLATTTSGSRVKPTLTAFRPLLWSREQLALCAVGEPPSCTPCLHSSCC